MQKFDTILIGEGPSTYDLIGHLRSSFPEIAVDGKVHNYEDACRLIRKVHPALVFTDVPPAHARLGKLLKTRDDEHFEVIYISNRPEDAIHAVRDDASDFLLAPLNITDVVLSVGRVIKKLSERTTLHILCSHESSILPHSKLIGIPLLSGIEFLYSNEIVRCEGLQKCTQIFSSRRKTLISSHNIGEFRKLLEQDGFFMAHKSHLINLMYVRRLTQDGFIHLDDNSSVPLARRKKFEFLQNLKHL
ncbi:MAG: LytR/AlgR family response regulator transcription factor [Bacteroidota bacterium]